MPKRLDKPTHKLIELGDVRTFAEVIATFEEIVDWSVEATTPIGYFAVIYKQATVAIHDAIKKNKFDDPVRMLEFQLTFAKRYFTALNAYNGHGDFVMPTHVWAQSFDASTQNQPIVFQHLLTGLNAHMNLDLGIAAATAGRSSMRSLRRDFEIVNAVLGYQVEAVLDAIGEISPVIRDMQECILGEVAMFRGLIVLFREKAWRFACDLADAPVRRNAGQIALHDARHVELGTRYVYVPEMFEFLINRIAEEESRDVAENIKALNRMSTPGWTQITDYGRKLDDAAESPPDDEDEFFEEIAETMRARALGFVFRR